MPTMAMARRSGSRQAARPLLSAALLVAAFVAASTKLVCSFVNPAAPSGLLGTGREVSVARAVNHHGFNRGGVLEECKPMSDKELHTMIKECRKGIMNHRLDVFRKRKPTRKSLYNMQYKIAIAKTLLKQRELELLSKEAVEPDEDAKEPTEEEEKFATKWTAAEAANAYERFAKRPNKQQGNKRDRNRPNYGFHSPQEKSDMEAFVKERRASEELPAQKKPDFKKSAKRLQARLKGKKNPWQEHSYDVAGTGTWEV